MWLVTRNKDNDGNSDNDDDDTYHNFSIKKPTLEHVYISFFKIVLCMSISGQVEQKNITKPATRVGKKLVYEGYKWSYSYGFVSDY